MSQQSGCTTTGVKEMRDQVRALPKALHDACRSVARNSAQRIQAAARENLRRQTRGTGATAAAITVTEAPERKAFIVGSSAPPGRHPALPIFLEYGTKRAAARPYLGPAADAEDPHYTRALRSAVDDLAEGLV